MASSWERLVSVTLGSTGDTLSSGTFTAKKHLHVECYSEATGGAIQSNIRFNGTGSSDNDYVYRHSGNGGSDATRVSRNDIEPYQAANIATGTSQYVVLDIINIDGQEKLITGNTTKQNTAGAGTAPDRREFVGKYVTTSGQITSIQFVNNGGDSGDFSTNSTVTVWGADDQPSTAHDKSTITNVPAGTRYEETDNRKIFRRKDDGFTVGLGDSADMASDTGNTSVATITGQTDAPTFTTKGWSASSLQAYTETDALLIENDDWTISFWMNSTSFTSMGGSKSPRLVNGRTSGDVNTSLLIEGSAGNNPPSTHILNAQIYKDPSGAVAANGSSGMVTNNWYNVVVTWTKSSGTVTFYVDYDGASSTGTVGSSTNMLLPASGGYWLLGSVAEQFVGYVTDYAFWNKVLTSSERQALYNSGAGVAANTIAKENLRVYYDCQSEPEVQKNGATPAAWVEKGTA